METKIPVYEAKIQISDNTGIYAVSFVEWPAIEKNFVALRKQRAKLALNKQKQILTGPVLVPDQLVYRFDDRLGEYYLKFSAEEIEKIAQKMMKTGVALNNTTHRHEKPLKGNYLTEIWTVKDPKRDKSVALGLGELPAGTLVASYKVGDAQYWRNEVLTGNVKGFSLEGIFNFNNVSMKKNVKKPVGAKPNGKGLPAFFRTMAAMLEGDTEAATEDLADEAAKDETGSGDPYLIFELSGGGEVWVDEEGFCTLDGEQMPAGEHALTDGNFLVVDDSGMMVITEPEPEGAEPEAAAAELAKQKKAKERAKQLFAKKDPKAAKIAALEKELAELKKQPSASKAEPAAEKKKAELSYTDKMAAVIKNRRERFEKRNA